MLPDKNTRKIERYLFHIFETLCDFEGRKQEVIIESIINVDKDIWKISLAKGMNIGSLDLNDVEEIIKSIKSLFSYSASSEQETKPYFEKSLSTGKSFVKECKFGHTYAGSFGFTIITPIDNPEYQTLEIGIDDKLSVPLGRRINERILKSLELINKEEEIEDITQVYEETLNANMCIALKKLLEISKADVEYSVQFSPLCDIPPAMKDKSTICIKQSGVNYLDSVYKKMHTEYELIKNFTLRGIIRELKGKKSEGDDDNSDYNIIITGDIGNRDEERIHITLNEKDYVKACELHKESVKRKTEKLIKISGNLRRTKQKWYLDSYFNFEELKDIRLDIRTDNAIENKAQKNLGDFHTTILKEQKEANENLKKYLKTLFEETQEEANTAYKVSKGTNTEEIACSVNREVQKWKIGSQEEITKNVEDLVYILKTKVSNLPENEYILKQIEAMSHKNDIVEQLKIMDLVIAQIPTMKVVTAQELGHKPQNLDLVFNKTVSIEDKLSRINYDIFKSKLNSHNVISNLDDMKKELEKLNETEVLNALSLKESNSIQADKLNDLNKDILERLEEIRTLIDDDHKNNDTQKIIDSLNGLKQSNSNLLLQRSSEISSLIGFITRTMQFLKY